MGLARSMLLWASRSDRLRRVVPRLWFVRRAVRRFIPGEALEAALGEARGFAERGIPTTLTHLGENVTEREEADAVVEHYIGALDRIAEAGLDTEISVKLTHLGLDLDTDLARRNLERCVQHAADLGNWVWIDMESSGYVDRTVDIYRHVLGTSRRVGVCLQSNLYRTEEDVSGLLSLKPSIRLVKGAYREAKEIAFQRKSMVDANFLSLSERILKELAEGRVRRYAVATHDVDLLSRIAHVSRGMGLSEDAYEIQMLYGIRQADQYGLAGEGYPVRTLIAYGPAWYPWYVRRLAERPANVWFVLRSMFGRGPKAADAPVSPG